MTTNSKATQLTVKLEDLILDTKNPRFAELYSGSVNEDDLIEYLLDNEAAEEVAGAIVKAKEFYPDKPLWVLKSGSKYIVKDGNRRCAAVKALQLPGKYNLSLPKTKISELPVLLYKRAGDVNERIVEEHAGNLFRRWERIAKALEILKLADTGKWEEATELDSKPGDLIKLASFYKEAVKIGGDDLKILLRRGRGKTGGKTIIFERLFRDSKKCGYRFRSSPSFRIVIENQSLFSTYISSLIKYLKLHPSTKTEDIDGDKNWLSKLIPFGFDSEDSGSTSSTNGQQSTGVTAVNASSSGSVATPNSGVGAASVLVTGNSTVATATSGRSTRGTVKNSPEIKRKQLPPGLAQRIKEYYSIDAQTQPNSKVAMARVTFECVLKYVLEETKYNTRTTIFNSPYFNPVRPISPNQYTDFTKLKNLFAELIINRGKKQAFRSFNLEDMHAVVHNYNINAIPANGATLGHNLIVLIEFMLQDRTDFLNSLDISKL